MGREQSEELKIVRYGHPALRRKAAPVRRAIGEVRDLVERMVELMRAANGVGLAANQVGVPRRVAVVDVDGEVAVLVDPELVSAKGSQTVEEGCLSLPRLYGDVVRPARVTVRARDLSGKRIKLSAEGLLARALCHEIDHLNGKLFVDEADESTLHWLVGTSEEGEQIIEPTTLEEALKVFIAARRLEG